MVEKALHHAELVIVQDAYHPTETTRFADVLLPAAQWPEKDGVMTNSERRLTFLPKLVDPPGEALPDAVIITRFAREMGWGAAFRSERAADIFDRSLGANNLEAGSELWWRAKTLQIKTMVQRGQFDAADIALRDLERTTQDYDGNK